jgi:hypothetical protein
MSVKIDYAELDESVFQNYFQYMIGKIYKILPMKEEGCKTLTSYLESLKIEMIGSYGLYRQLMEEPQFMTALNIVEYLIDNDYDNAICKREVFKAIRCIENINKKYFGREG